MIPVLWPYKLGSASAKALASRLETKRVRSNGKYRPRANHLIINWGNSELARWQVAEAIQHRQVDILNNPVAVRRATNKIVCLQILSGAGIQVPMFATDGSGAEELLHVTGGIFCRTLTRANSGRGIVIATSPEEIVPAPLYTVDVGKRREYRAHVFNGEVIDFAQKKKLTTEQLEERGIPFCKDIRSHDNGWIFARENVDLPEEVGRVALAAIRALGLDFGAVDCYFTSRDNPNPQIAGVFEVNTAPGLEGTTLDRYVEAIERML